LHGEAKHADDEARRLLSSAAPIAITGPRLGDPELVNSRDKKHDMDDEIPF
jgi:hypothetical protein